MATLINPWTVILVVTSRGIFGLMRFQLAMQQARRLIEADHPEYLDKLAAVVRADRPSGFWPHHRRP